MLTRHSRLLGRENFSAVAKKGRYFSAGIISLKFKKNDESWPRIGFSVGLKFSKKAVERNAAKRKLRAIAREIMPQIKENADIIVVLQKNPPSLSSAVLKKDLEAALKQSRLI